MNNFQNAVYGGIGIGTTIGGAMIAAYGIKNLYALHDISQERALTEDELTKYRASITELIIGTGACFLGVGIVTTSSNIDFALGQTDILRKIQTGEIYVDYNKPEIPTQILEKCGKIDATGKE